MHNTHTNKQIWRFFSPSVVSCTIRSPLIKNIFSVKLWKLLPFSEEHRPRSRALKEPSLMSVGKPVSARFTVTPPNRSTLPVSRSVPSTRCSWERTAALVKARTSERAGPDVLLHNRPVSSGRYLRLKLQAAIIIVVELTLVFLKGR